MSESNEPREVLQPEDSKPGPVEAVPTPQADIQPEDGKKKQKTTFAEDCYGWVHALCVALGILIVCFTFLGRVVGVEGSSMVPTLEDQDMLLLRCAGYHPQQGDVVVLHKDFAEIHFPIVKRVIAVGGQTVEINYDTGTVYVDGVALDEPYIAETMRTPGSAYEQGTYWNVPEGSIFVMGDNRNASSDSRHADLGVVDERYVLGKVVCVIFPFQHIGVVH